MNPLEAIVARARKVADNWRLTDATVAGLAPLTVALDGDTTAVQPTKLPLVAGLRKGDRVACAFIGRHLLILGRYGGQAATSAPEYIVIDGMPYLRGGVLVPPIFEFIANTNGVYTTVVRFPVPYAPPPGWDFDVRVVQSRGNTIVTTYTPSSGGYINARVMQVGNNDATALAKIGWQLVKV